MTDGVTSGSKKPKLFSIFLGDYLAIRDMTLAFETFMKLYKMTGSEKADGYSRDAFIGLEEHEKSEVFKLLVTELPWSAEWIFFLDPEKASVVAKENEKELRGDPYANVYLLQQQLVKYSGDIIYQKHMIEDYPNYIDRLKPYVVDSIGRTPSNEAKVAFLKQVILVETNESAVASASCHLLNAVKFPRTNEADERNYTRLMSELRSDSTQVKQRAIAEVENFKLPF